MGNRLCVIEGCENIRADYVVEPVCSTHFCLMVERQIERVDPIRLAAIKYHEERSVKYRIRKFIHKIFNHG